MSVWGSPEDFERIRRAWLSGLDLTGMRKLADEVSRNQRVWQAALKAASGAHLLRGLETASLARAMRLASFIGPEQLEALNETNAALSEFLSKQALGAVPNAELTRQLLESIRSTSPSTSEARSGDAAQLESVAAEAASELPAEDAIELEATSSELRAFLEDLEPDQRRAVLERLGVFVLAVAAYVHRLIVEENTAALLPTLAAVLFTLLLLYNAVQKAINDVEDDRFGTE